jgi:putative membrane-bound dehydrogenase-like protein
MRSTLFGAALLFTLASSAFAQSPIKILFLGDNAGHKPNTRFRILQPIFEKRGIELTYTDTAAALNAKTLDKYDGLLIYSNITKISPEQEKDLLDYVASGKGFIPVHCASYCFLNSEKYIELVGAQFKSHGVGTFKTVLAEPDHPIMKGFAGFESFDETYVHTKHNMDRTVLEYRADKKGKEPWTWVRTHGKGRVFYTAWGHDEKTWETPGFHDLLERGVKWAVGTAQGQPSLGFRDTPKMTAKREDVKPFEYKDAKIPFYAPKFGSKTPPTKMQLPLEPEESIKHFVHPTDFIVKKFVSEPQIKRPLCMTWDERGRLWIAESVDYPNNLQRGDGNDRIVICEDTDNDGVADKFTVFADKLSIPTSMCFANGGLIVHAAPNTLFLKASKGDDVCDSRTVLFSGWGAGDTHAGPSNLHYGFDNWIYGIVGYSGFNGRVGGENHKFSQGFYRFKPDGSKLEFLRSTTNNSWGVGFSEEGLLFGSTANGNASVFMPIPNRYYEKVRGMSAGVAEKIIASNKFNPITDKVRQVDFHGGFTAAAGHALYTARAYPKEYWNRTAFVTEPTGHLVATLVINKSGSSFTSRNAWNLLASDDEWSAPTMAEVGPDGNVWVIDWYNFIVQHNPTPPGFKTGKGNAYETELRDKTHGRIYRLVPAKAQGRPSLGVPDLTSPEKQVAALRNDNLLWRKHAQRLLVERGKQDVVPALVKLIEDPSVDEIGLNVGAIHALWTLNGLGAGKEAPQAFESALKHKSAAVRRNAVQTLPANANSVDALVASGVLSDTDSQVRLAALLKLTDLPKSDKAAPALVKLLTRPGDFDDRNLADALTMSAVHNDAPVLREVAATNPDLSTKAAGIVTIVAENYAHRGPDTVGAVLASLKDGKSETTQAILAGLAKGWPKGTRVKLDEAAEKSLANLFPTLPTSSRGQLTQLAKAMGSTAFEKQSAEIAKALLATVLDERQTDAARIAAAQQLTEFNDDAKLLEQFLDLITPRTSPQLAVGLLDAVGASGSSNVGSMLLKRMPGFTPQARSTALRIMLSRAETTRQFLDAVDKGSLTFSELALDQKQALANHPDTQIADRAKALLAKGGGLPNADRQKVVEEMLAVIKKTGDVAKGKEAFKKHCALCHTHSGEGTKIGPDLSGVAVHTKEHLLVDILDPSRSVEGNYRVYTVETRKGIVLNGLLASETKTTIELFNTEGKKLVVERDDIESIAASSKSLMPEGFEKTLKQEELVDLLEFLTARGKFVPIALDKAATIISTQGMFYSKDSTQERLVLTDWSPRAVKGVPFQLVDPQKDTKPNAIMLYSKNGEVAATMPKSAKLDCNIPAKTIHLLSGVSGWGYPFGKNGGVVMIVRLHYADGKTEDHPLKDGEHFADYIRKVEVPKSEFAFSMRSQQMRYLTVPATRDAILTAIEFVKGPDPSAPIVLAVTVETK